MSVKKIFLLIGVAALVCIMGAACRNDEATPGSDGGRGILPGMGSGSGGAVPTGPYVGVAWDVPDTYTASFEIRFEADAGPSNNWTYQLDLLFAGGALRRSLSIDGVPERLDPGDITLIRSGDTQYMTGEAVTETAIECLIFPADVDLEASFLTPDDFVSPALLNEVLKSAGRGEGAGERGELYTFEASTLGDFTDVSGELLLSSDGGYVLRYDFSGQTVDRRFTDGQPGTLSWRFEITDLEPTESVEVPDTCQIEYPIMPDAVNLTRLPGRISYLSPSSRADVVAFYEQALPEAGWERYNFPAVTANNTLLIYARGGELLNVNIIDKDGGVEVQIFLEDRPPQP